MTNQSKFAKSGDAGGEKKPKQTANDLTKTAIKLLNMSGFVVWRNNTMGVFDINLAVENISKSYHGQLNPVIVRQQLHKSYRKSHERLGISDIIGFKKGGDARFIAVEIKAGKDKISPEQEQFGKEVVKNGGYYVIIRNTDDIISWINDNK